MSKEELIESYGSLYHITDEKNKGSIQEQGLTPNKYAKSDYHPKAPEIRAQVCLAAKNKAREQLHSFKDNTSEKRFVIFKIPASIIATLNFGLDWTFSGTEALSELSEIEALTISIDDFGTLACFDTIQPEHLTIIGEDELNRM